MAFVNYGLIPDREHARPLGLRVYPNQNVIGLYDIQSGQPIGGIRDIHVDAGLECATQAVVTLLIESIDSLEADDATTKPEAG